MLILCDETRGKVWKEGRRQKPSSARPWAAVGAAPFLRPEQHLPLAQCWDLPLPPVSMRELPPGSAAEDFCVTPVKVPGGSAGNQARG